MRISKSYGWTSLLYEIPGGNQVDGLPPVASYYRRRADLAETGPVEMCDFLTFGRHRLRAALMDRALALHCF